MDTKKLTPLPCVNKIYTNTPGKVLKIANNSSKCYNTSKALGIEAKFNDCYHCHRQCLDKYNKNELFLIKK